MEEKYKFEENDKEYIIRFSKEMNYTLEDLKKVLINALYEEINECEKIDAAKVELLKIIKEKTR